MDLALLSVLRDGLLRHTDAAALTSGNVELRDNGTALINVRRSKTDPEAERVTLYTGPRPAEELLDQNTSVFGLSPRQIERRVSAAAMATGLDEGFTGHSGRLGMAQDLAKTGGDLPVPMTAGHRNSETIPARLYRQG